jgi:hypothetical protein
VLADDDAELVGEGGGGAFDGFVLADQAAELVADIFRAGFLGLG